MNILRSFLPWIAFSVLSSIVGWQWGALFALVATIASLVYDRRAGIGLDAQILDLGTFIFFLFATVAGFVAPHSVLGTYDGGLSSVWLAVIAGVSLAVRRPFTAGIAKRQAPREIWNTAGFLRFNMVLTAVWTLSFVVGAALTIACEIYAAPLPIRVLCQLVGFVVPMVFTRRYVARRRARTAAAADGAGASPTVA
jgi:hypothetical protein